jgi:hypothetical protein
MKDEETRMKDEVKTATTNDKRSWTPGLCSSTSAFIDDRQLTTNNLQAPGVPRMPTSQARIDANRRNAKRSTGARTPEGRRRSSQNALKHGLRSRAIVISRPEIPIKFRNLRSAPA